MNEKRILLLGGGLFLALGIVLLPALLKKQAPGPAAFAGRGPTVSQPLSGALSEPAAPSQAGPSSAQPAAGQAQSTVEQANAFMKQENYAAAIPLFQKFLESNEDPDVMTSLAVCLRQQGKTDEALGWLDRSLKLRPQGLEAKYYLGLIQQYDRADFESAIRTFEEVLPLMPQEHRSELSDNVEYMKRVRANLLKTGASPSRPVPAATP